MGRRERGSEWAVRRRVRLSDKTKTILSVKPSNPQTPHSSLQDLFCLELATTALTVRNINLNEGRVTY